MREGLRVRDLANDEGGRLLRSEKAYGSPHRTDPSLRFSTDRRNSTQDFGLAAIAQPISTVPAQSGVGAPRRCSPQKNWAERRARWRWPFGTWRGMTRLSKPSV